MQARINVLLEAMWRDIRTDLNSAPRGLQLIRLERHLKRHSRIILTELGRYNFPALPPNMVEEMFKTALPQGVDPLITSLLSYLKIEVAQEMLYLDPLYTVRDATRELRRILVGISVSEYEQRPVNNLAFLQYNIYQTAISSWQEVINRNYAAVENRLRQRRTYSFIRDELARQAVGDNPEEGDDWKTFIPLIETRLHELERLSADFQADGDLPHIFYATPLTTWQRLMLHDSGETLWRNLWNRRANPPPIHFTGSNVLLPAFNLTCYAAAKLLKVFTHKGGYYLKSYKTLITEQLNERIEDYRQTITDCKTLLAINKAKLVGISKEETLSAQALQLKQLETYLTAALGTLDAYAIRKHPIDNTDISFVVRLKAYLGFNTARAERDSTIRLAEVKTTALARVRASTAAIIDATRRARGTLASAWVNEDFENIKDRIDNFHQVIHAERRTVTASFERHNSNFRNEWYFWRRKTMLPEILTGLSRHCPVVPGLTRTD